MIEEYLEAMFQLIATNEKLNEEEKGVLFTLIDDIRNEVSSLDID